LRYRNIGNNNGNNKDSLLYNFYNSIDNYILAILIKMIRINLKQLEELINMVREDPGKKRKKGTRKQKRKNGYPKRVKIRRMNKKGRKQFSK